MTLHIHVFLAKIQVPIWTCLLSYINANITMFVTKV